MVWSCTPAGARGLVAKPGSIDFGWPSSGGSEVRAVAEALVESGRGAQPVERARAELHELLDRAAAADFDRPSNGTRWTNEQLLFHMVFGFMVVARLLPLVRVLGRLPAPVSRSYAWLLETR